MCKFFGVSRSGYYAFLERMDIPDRDLPLADKIRECQEESKNTYGYRRVHGLKDKEYTVIQRLY